MKHHKIIDLSACEHSCVCMSHIYVNLINIPSLRAFSWKLTFPLCLWEEIGCLINCLYVSQSLNTSDRMCTKALKKRKKKTLNIRSCCIPYMKWMQLPWQQHTELWWFSDLLPKWPWLGSSSFLEQFSMSQRTDNSVGGKAQLGNDAHHGSVRRTAY